MIDKNHQEECSISLILRIAVASIFGVASYIKFTTGFNSYVEIMTNIFKDTFLPGWLLKPYIYGLPFAEGLVVVWLLVGIKLRYAWTFAALVFLTLGFGMIVAKQGATASENFIYMMMACLGIYLSKYDKCGLSLGKRKK
jgi:hypothetical protein